MKIPYVHWQKLPTDSVYSSRSNKNVLESGLLKNTVSPPHHQEMNQRLRHCLTALACATLLAMVLPRPGEGHVLIVQGAAIDAYQQAVDGFTKHFTSSSMPGIASLQPSETIILDPADHDSTSTVNRKEQELQPELIVAVGTPALEAVKRLPPPIIYLMVPNPDPLIAGRSDITGVKMMSSPELQFAAIKTTFPAVTRVGFLHNPQRNIGVTDLAREAANRLDLTFIDLTAASDRQALTVMNGMQGNRLDALIIAPEPSIISPILMEGLTLFSLEQQVPLIVFAPKYLQLGGAMTIYTTPEQAGRQAAEMAKRILNNPQRVAAPPEYGHEATVLTNDRIIHQLGVVSTRPYPSPEGENP